MWEQIANLLNLKTFIIAALIFTPLESLFSDHPSKSIFRSGWMLDVIYALTNSILVKIGLFLLISVGLFLVDFLIPKSFRTQIGNLPVLIQLPIIIMIADISYYWSHRMFHKIPFLWKFHAIHHSSEELDWLASMRNHPVDLIITKTFSLLPIFALGFSTVSISLFATLFFWQSAFIHSKIRLPFGPLKWAVATPEFHHWHHANNPEFYNKNFAAQLPILDALFGTLRLPRGSAPTEYGTLEPLPDGYVGQVCYPLRGRGISNTAQPSRNLENTDR